MQGGPRRWFETKFQISIKIIKQIPWVFGQRVSYICEYFIDSDFN